MVERQDRDKDPLQNLIRLSDYRKQEDTSYIFPRKYIEPVMPNDYDDKLSHLSDLTQKVALKAETEESLAELSKQVEDNYSDFSQFRIRYDRELNGVQLACATHITGPLMVIAGAGTGKTRTIVYRVSYMLERGVDPQSILLLTFTRKAATEMLNRVNKLLGDDSADRVRGGTFHSFANHLLRRYGRMINLRPNFTILDQEDSEEVVDLLRREYGFHTQVKAFPKKDRLFKLISTSKNTGKSLDELVEEQFTGLKDYLEEIKTLTDAYKQYKHHYQLLDYDDLLLVLRNQLRDNSDFLSQVRSDIGYVLVDEYQDTNIIQKEIVDLLAGEHRNVMVVGDDFQSIYAFRGANWENILRFPETYPDARVIKLEQNYRSKQELLDFSNEIVTSARVGYEKHLSSDLGEGVSPYLNRYYSQQQEAEAIVSRILELREQDLSLSDMAVIYRAGFHSSYIQTELLKRKIPYVVYGGVKFMERRHVKDMISYLRLLVNPYDAVSWNRVLKLISGIGNVRASEIVEEIYQEGGSLDFDVYQGKSFYPNLKSLENTLRECRGGELSPPEQVGRIQEYYLPILKEQEQDAAERQKDLEVIYFLSQNYDEMDRFLHDLSLDPPSKQFQKQSSPLVNEEEEDELVLTTVHSAKGLEWHTVFLPHLLDGLFPTARSLRDVFWLEEERRLFYVACSRAKEQLYLTFPHQVSSYEGFFVHPSRFLKPISTNLYNFQDSEDLY